MPVYNKEVIQNHLNSYNYVHSNLFNYLKSKDNILSVEEIPHNKFQIIMHNMPNSPINISIFERYTNYVFPRFFIMGFNIIKDINDFQFLLIYNLLESYDIINNPNNTFIVVNYLREIEKQLNNTGTFIGNITYNNYVKQFNKVKVIKPYIEKKHSTIYFKILVKAFKNALSEEDYYEIGNVFNDPIAPKTVNDNVFCKIDNGKLINVGLELNDNEIKSIYPIKANLPERLRQHFTSSYLTPINPSNNYLSNNRRLLGDEFGAICVFLEINSNETLKVLPYDTLLAGEILATTKFSNQKIKLYRMISIDRFDIETLPVGSIVNPGDVIAWNKEGDPVAYYNLKYKNAKLASIDINNSVIFRFEIEDYIKVSRIIGETGIKGMIHPVDDLGYINNVYGEKIEVDMVVGPNGIKSGSNGIRLAWLSLKKALGIITDEVDVMNEEEVNRLTDDIHKVEWIYKGQSVNAYVGYVNFGVTELSRDYKTQEISISPEILKYLHSMHDERYSEIADLLIEHYTEKDRNKLNNMISIVNKKNAAYPIEKIYSVLYKYLDNNFIVPSLVESYNNVYELSLENNGITFKYDNIYINLPSHSILSKFLDTYNGLYKVPKCVRAYRKILYHISNNAEKQKILDAIDEYYDLLKNHITKKKGILYDTVSPKIMGGHFKQLVDARIPFNVVVVIDNELKQYIHKLYTKYNLDKIYTISARNPVLWRFQVRIQEVWTYDQYIEYLNEYYPNTYRLDLNKITSTVIRNTYDVMMDQSDTDGDLFPIAIPNIKEFHELVLYTEYENKFNKMNELFYYENNWINKYIEGESDNSKLTNIENKKYKIYKINRQDFGKLIINSAISKQKIGIATISLWQFFSAAEIYKYMYNNIDYTLANKLVFIYSAIVQDIVVRGIKHTNSNGSFDTFNVMLFNEKKALPVLKDYYGLSETEIQHFNKIVKMANEPYVKLLGRLLNGVNIQLLKKYIESIEKLSLFNFYDNLSITKVHKLSILQLTNLIN